MSRETRFSTRLLKQAQPSLNKVEVIYENQQGIELAEWLRKESNRRSLDNKRILYVMRANMDNSLIKFGVGGVEHGGTSAYGRLLQYINYYGEGGEFDCLGIKLFLIVANNYNANVEGKNSAIFRKEKFLKAQLKGDTMTGRGTERVTTNLRKLFNLILQKSNQTDEDIELERRKTERIQQQDLQPDDRVVKIESHITPSGKGMTRYRAIWNRPNIQTERKKDKDGNFVVTEKKDFGTDQFYHQLIKFQDGKEAVDKYIEQLKVKKPNEFKKLRNKQ
jgi:hypothetical protein